MAGVGHEHDVVVFGDSDGAYDAAGLGGDFHGDDAFSSASFGGVVFEWGSFAEAFFADDEELFFVVDDGEGDEVVVIARADAGDS